MVTVEESNLVGGWGSELSARIMDQGFDYLDGPVLRVGAPHTPVPATPTLEDFYVPDANRIVEAVNRLVA
jgi:pyruvate dehydrogenase E1 component beta subunit